MTFDLHLDLEMSLTLTLTLTLTKFNTNWTNLKFSLIHPKYSTFGARRHCWPWQGRFKVKRYPQIQASFWSNLEVSIIFLSWDMTVYAFGVFDLDARLTFDIWPSKTWGALRLHVQILCAGLKTIGPKLWPVECKQTNKQTNTQTDKYTEPINILVEFFKFAK